MFFGHLWLYFGYSLLHTCISYPVIFLCMLAHFIVCTISGDTLGYVQELQSFSSPWTLSWCCWLLFLTRWGSSSNCIMWYKGYYLGHLYWTVIERVVVSFWSCMPYDYNINFLMVWNIFSSSLKKTNLNWGRVSGPFLPGSHCCHPQLWLTISCFLPKFWKLKK